MKLEQLFHGKIGDCIFLAEMKKVNNFDQICYRNRPNWYRDRTLGGRLEELREKNKQKGKDTKKIEKAENWDS